MISVIQTEPLHDDLVKKQMEDRIQRHRQEWQQVIVFYPPDLKSEWWDRPLPEIVLEGITVLKYSQYYQAKEAMNVIYVDNRGNSVLLKSVLSRPVGSKASDWKIEQ